MRPIDADKAKELIKEQSEKSSPLSNVCKKSLTVALNAIDLTPTADVVPIEEVAKEFTCVFGQPHKVSDCPINEEIEKSKAYTVQEMQLRFARHFGTYTDNDEVKILEVFRLIGKFAEEMLEDAE